MCIFCKIINNEIPSYKLYEDEYVLAFLDISQTTIGHTLVIPKRHFKNILELDGEYSSHVFKVVTLLSKQISKNLKINDINIMNNNGPLAGQTVDHFHIHIIPRYPNDGVKIEYKTNKLSIDQFNDLQEIILEKNKSAEKIPFII